MTADKLETFIDALISEPNYQTREVRYIINNGLQTVRILIEQGKSEEAKARLAKMAADVRAALAKNDAASEIDPDATPTVEEARQYIESTLGPEYFFGPSEVEDAFEIPKIQDEYIPPLPPWREIIRHTSQNHELRLRIDENNIGRPSSTPMSIDGMVSFINANTSLLVEGFQPLIQIQKLREMCVRPGWAFTTPGVPAKSIPFSRQTTVLISYVKNTLFKEEQLPPDILNAHQEWQSLYGDFMGAGGLANSTPEQMALLFMNASVTQLHRSSFAETMYDFLVEYGGSDSFDRNSWGDAICTSTRKGTKALVFNFASNTSADALQALTISMTEENPSVGSRYSRFFPAS